MTRDFARNQIGRFAMLDRFPRTETAAITDLVDALMTCPPTREAWLPQVAQSIPDDVDPAEGLARQVVESFLGEGGADRCPMAREIRTAIADRLHELRANPDCPKCGGIGEIIGRRSDGTVIGSKGCDCYARRPVPVYPQPGDERVGLDIKGEIYRVAQGKRA